jgi:adenylate cyclase
MSAVKRLKSVLKWFVTVTPLKVTFSIVSFFVAISFLNDIGRNLPLLRMLDNKSLDVKFSLRGPRLPESKTIIVAIDEKSLGQLGQWPFDRAKVMAPLLQKLCSYEPRAVGLDVMWPEEERAMSSAVEQQIRSLNQTAAQQSKLDEALKAGSGDLALKRAVEACGDRLVQGYTLSSAPPELSGKKLRAYEAKVNALIQANRVQFVTKSAEVIVPKSLEETERDEFPNTEFQRFRFGALLNNDIMFVPESSMAYMNNESESDDGNYRNYVPVMTLNGQFVPSLALALTTKYHRDAETKKEAKVHVNIPHIYSGKTFSLKIKNRELEINVPVDKTGKMISNYYGPNEMFPHVSLSDVVSDSETISYLPSELRHKLSGGANDEEPKPLTFLKKDFFKDSIVLIGATAYGLSDIRPRPLAQDAVGVENHATVVDNLITGSFLERPDAETLLALLSALFIIGIIYGIIIAKLSAKPGFIFAFVVIAAVLYVDQKYLFNERGIVFSGHLQAIQFLLQYLGITVLKYVREEADKKFIRGAFDKFVSPAVIEQLIEDPTKLRIGGEKRELSILFSDVAGFTELSEKLEARVLTSFLNDYLGAMTDIVQENKGTLDKYIGDAVMAFWGAPVDTPDHADLAVKTAIQMQEKIVELNKNFKEKYGFEIEVRIGINTGEVSVGNFGSSKVFEYTVIGDNVNLASRLEGVNKYYGTHITISEFTKSKLMDSKWVLRELDTIKVKGKQKPVKIYEVLWNSTSKQSELDAVRLFTQSLEHYYAKRWSEAISGFKKVLELKGEDIAATEFIERCEHYMSHPPIDSWDGSWEMTSK